MCRKNAVLSQKIRWKAKKSLDVWQGWHQALEVQQALKFHSSKFYIPQENPVGFFYYIIYALQCAAARKLRVCRAARSDAFPGGIGKGKNFFT